MLAVNLNNWDQFKADKLSLMGRDCRKVLDIGQSARDDEIYFENTKYVTLDLDRTICSFVEITAVSVER
jgi:hypothetical protein